MACALSIDQRKLVLSKQKFTPWNHRALQKACVTKNSVSYLHNHIHWLNFTLKGHFMLAFPERMALLTFQNPKLYHIDIPQVCVCLCALVMAITALDCGFRCLMDSLSLRLSPSWLQQTEGGVQAQDHKHCSSRKEGRKERSAWAEIKEWDAGTAACVLINMRDVLFYEL